MVTNFLSTYWAEIVLALTIAGATAGFKFLFNKLKGYKAIIEEKKQAEAEELIQEKLDPIVADIEELRDYIRKTSDREVEHINLIISSYRYRLIQLCKLYLRQKYMLQDQYEQLLEFYRLYSGLGGNGQAKEYYDKVMQLPVVTQEMGSN